MKQKKREKRDVSSQVTPSGSSQGPSSQVLQIWLCIKGRPTTPALFLSVLMCFQTAPLLSFSFCPSLWPILSLPLWLCSVCLSAHLHVHLSASISSLEPHSSPFSQINPLIPDFLLGVISQGDALAWTLQVPLTTLYFITKTAVIIVDGQTYPLSVEEYGSFFVERV